MEKEAGDIASRSVRGQVASGQPQTVIELGAGSGAKTTILLKAFGNVGPTTYMPIDVSGEAMEACARVCATIPNVDVSPVIGTFDDVLSRTIAEAATSGKDGARVTVMFLGSSVGNYDDKEILSLLRVIKGALPRAAACCLALTEPTLTKKAAS